MSAKPQSTKRFSDRNNLKPAAQIRGLRRRLSPIPGRSISQQRFAELLGVSWSSVARWESGKQPDPKIGAKIDRLEKALGALGDFVMPEGRLRFFEERHPLLNNVRPIDFLDTAYGAEAVIDLIERAASGSFS